jgi:DNA replication and repair protein RecF
MVKTISLFREHLSGMTKRIRSIALFRKQKQKLLKRNGKEYQKLSDHVGRYPVVMISPADSALITEGSEDRRKFMNKIISQYSAEYLDSVLRYNKALQQRNKFLKDINTSGNFDPDSSFDLGCPTCEIW